MVMSLRYKGWSLKCLDESNYLVPLILLIIDEKFHSAGRVYKDSSRSFVQDFLYEGKRYIFKEFRKNKRYASTSFKNTDYWIRKGGKELVKIHALLERRLHGRLVAAFTFQEYIEGTPGWNHIEEIVSLVKKLHKLGIHLGECYPENFIMSANGLRVIDTNAKKCWSPFNRGDDFAVLTRALEIRNLPPKLAQVGGFAYTFSYFFIRLKESLGIHNVI